ncbi:hypothetical protein MFLO_12396 [Listeria floridensis FSL S10-1187]|uniref:DUF3606 domain-containing protein n=1 Tax=Listeria floridensis FSL S10-1187 TaxID=1265817 RepID=A0ABP3AVK2_9LIST|nr:hypothetical protein [Listeria floridensis]EUJ28196.1 hypothetical protein MFLO_12396 [Listeria floridensis FSL S10-1187]
MKKSTSTAQRLAADRWDNKNPGNRNHRVAKSTAKRFITKMASSEELAQVKIWVKEREAADDASK